MGDGGDWMWLFHTPSKFDEHGYWTDDVEPIALVRAEDYDLARATFGADAEAWAVPLFEPANATEARAAQAVGAFLRRVEQNRRRAAERNLRLAQARVFARQPSTRVCRTCAHMDRGTCLVHGDGPGMEYACQDGLWR